MSIHSTVAERSHFRAASFWVCETLSPEKRKRSRIPRRLTRGETDLPIGRCLLAEGGRIPGLGRFAPYRVQQERRKGPALRGNALRTRRRFEATRNFGNLHGEKRPGQDLNLRGVTHRFSRPAPYRTRRPGQRFILKTKARISVSDLGHKIDLGKASALLNRLDGRMAGGPVKDSRISGFPKREEGDRARGERQSPCEDHRGIQTAGVSEEANDDGTDGEPEVSPESVDAHGRPAGLRGCEIAHRS